MSLRANVWLNQSGTVYIKRAGTFQRYLWGGRWMRSGESTDNLGDVSITHRFNPRGGVERDSVLQGNADTVSLNIEMKSVQKDRTKDELKRYWFHIDDRRHIDGRDRDDPYAWEEITRRAWMKATGRTSPANNWEGEEESMITLPFTGLAEYDIYRVTYDDQTGSADAVSFTDITLAAPEHQNNTEEGALFYAVTSLEAAGSPYLAVNNMGGDLAFWEFIELTEWTTAGADAVLGLGDFVGIVSAGEAAILRSDDRGATRVEVTHADFAAHAPAALDGWDQTAIIIVGADGYIWASFDGLRTIELRSAGSATSEDLTWVQFDRINPQVIYAGGANNALIRSTNGGVTWEALTGPSPTDALLAGWVEDENHVLILNNDGEVWETADGGLSWLQQNAIAGMPAAPTVGRIKRVDCDVYYLLATDATTSIIARNVEGGASGYWTTVTDSPSDDVRALACADGNRVAVVGGSGTTANIVGLIS